MVTDKTSRASDTYLKLLLEVSSNLYTLTTPSAHAEKKEKNRRSIANVKWVDARKNVIGFVSKIPAISHGIAKLHIIHSTACQ